MKSFQRKGSKSNAHVGRDFEKAAKEFFAKKRIMLEEDLKLSIGISKNKKEHSFDLGSKTRNIVVECKSHKWTTGDNVPSAKLTVWNEAMYYFSLVPKKWRKIFFVLKDRSRKRNETLAEYYIRTYSHLIPYGVEFWEYNPKMKDARKIN
jgi:hypothetical protein